MTVPATRSDILPEAEDWRLCLRRISADLSVYQICLYRRPTCVLNEEKLDVRAEFAPIAPVSGPACHSLAASSVKRQLLRLQGRHTRAVDLQRYCRWLQELVERPLDPGLDLRSSPDMSIASTKYVPRIGTHASAGFWHAMHPAQHASAKRTRCMLSTRAAAGLRGEPTVFARTPDRRMTVTRRSFAS